MKRISNVLREAIVREAVAKRDAVADVPDRMAELERVARLTASVQVAPGHGYDLDAMDEAIVAARKVLA